MHCIIQRLGCKGVGAGKIPTAMPKGKALPGENVSISPSKPPSFSWDRRTPVRHSNRNLGQKSRSGLRRSQGPAGVPVKPVFELWERRTPVRLTWNLGQKSRSGLRRSQGPAGVPVKPVFALWDRRTPVRLTWNLGQKSRSGLRRSQESMWGYPCDPGYVRMGIFPMSGNMWDWGELVAGGFFARVVHGKPIFGRST